MLIGLLVLAAGLTLLVTQHDVNKNKQLFSSAAANSVQFPLYYPATLSKGLSLQPNSALFSTGVVTFNIYNKDANPLPVTEQAKPARFDFDSFYKNNFQVSQQFDTPVGRASIGKLQGINVCSLVTKNTWIIVTAPDSVATSNLPIICKGFQPLSD